MQKNSWYSSSVCLSAPIQLLQSLRSPPSILSISQSLLSPFSLVLFFSFRCPTCDLTPFHPHSQSNLCNLYTSSSSSVNYPISANNSSYSSGPFFYRLIKPLHSVLFRNRPIISSTCILLPRLSTPHFRRVFGRMHAYNNSQTGVRISIPLAYATPSWLTMKRLQSLSFWCVCVCVCVCTGMPVYLSEHIYVCVCVYVCVFMNDKPWRINSLP